MHWVSGLVLKLAAPVKAYNTVGPTYGQAKFQNFIDLIEGDFILLADIPEWVRFPEVRPTLHYIGPLPARINRPIPETITSMPRDRPIVFFAIGSSGKPALVAEILEGFRHKPYRVIAPVKSHIEKMTLDFPENVFVTGFLPAHKLNPMVAVSVIHGGQNTVMNVCLSGTPIVGIGMHQEQQANLNACVRKGFAVRLNKRRVGASEVLSAVDRLLHYDEAKKAVETFRKQLLAWDGPANAVRFLRKYYGS